MKISKFILLGVTALIFSACGSGEEPAMPAEEVISKGMNNLYDVKSGNYEVSFEGDIITPMGDGTTKTATIKLEIGGEFDETDPENTEMSLNLGFSASAEGEEDQSGKAEVRLLNKRVYASISELSDFGGQLPPEMMQSFLNQWWYIEVPAESLASKDERYKDLLGETVLFKDLEFIDTDDVNGVDSYHYSAVLDKDALSEYLAAVSQLEGGGLEASYYQTYMKDVEFEGEIWVAADALIVNRLMGNVKAKDTTGAGGEMDLVMDMGFGNFNGTVEIAEPENANFFDLAALFGGLGGAVTDAPVVDAPVVDAPVAE